MRHKFAQSYDPKTNKYTLIDEENALIFGRQTKPFRNTLGKKCKILIDNQIKK